MISGLLVFFARRIRRAFSCPMLASPFPPVKTAITLALITIFLTAAAGHAGAIGDRKLTLEAGFGKPYINGQLPGTLRISPGEKWIACTWAEDARGYSEIWLFSMDGSERRKLTDTKEARLAELKKDNEKIEDPDKRKTEEELINALERERNFGGLEWEKDGSRLWFVYRGNLYRIPAFPSGSGTPAMEKILHTGNWAGDIKFSDDGKFLGISLASEVWIRNLENGALIQLTTDARGGMSNYGLEWSASGRYLGFYQYEGGPLRTSWMIDYLSENANPVQLTRPRPGDTIGKTRFGVIDLQTEEFGKPKITMLKPGGGEELYGGKMVWAPDADRLLVSMISKNTETMTVWEAVDFETGDCAKLFEYNDEAWFNDAYFEIYWGPSADSFITCLETTGWSHVYQVDFAEKLASEKLRIKTEKEKAEAEKPKPDSPQAASETEPDDLHSQESEDSNSDYHSENIEDSADSPDAPAEPEAEAANGKTDSDSEKEKFPKPTQITFGEYEVTWIQVLKDRRTAYIITTEDGPYYRTVLKLDIPSRGKKRVTNRAGFWSFGGGWGEGIRISDAENVAILYGSDFGAPAALYAVALEKGNPHLVYDSRPADWRQWRWVFPEEVSFQNIEFPGRVHALLFLPSYHKDGDKRPVIVHIHGAGYAQDVSARHSWFDAHHTYLAETLGYAVLVVDYRGSSGYGREWRTQVAGRLGWLEDSDARAGVEYLRRSGIADMDKIGIWGWSYGGFQTNMSMFISPGYWKAGVAMAAVNDWANYNHWYVTQRLDDPKEKKDAYKKSSTITHSEGLEGDLLMIHGILDDNVLAQDFMQLSAKLINENKNFEMFAFPEDGHGIYSDKRMIYLMRLVADYFESKFGKGPGA